MICRILSVVCVMVFRDEPRVPGASGRVGETLFGASCKPNCLVTCDSLLKRAVLLDKVIVVRQLGKITIDKSTQLFELPL